jgi:hypothetical protein
MKTYKVIEETVRGHVVHAVNLSHADACELVRQFHKSGSKGVKKELETAEG